jgi:two-component system, OmpR family, sensor kinase
MTLSLRGRLLIGVISLVVVGLLVSDLVTYVLLQNSLTGRIDQQLTARSTVDTAVQVISNGCRVGGPASAGGFPAGTVTELLGSDGTVVTACRVGGGFGGATSTGSPVLPKSLHSGGTDQPVNPFNVAGTGDVEEFRMTDWTENSFNGQFVVFAIPFDDVRATLNQLLQLEMFIGLGVVGATALLAWLIIRIGLRPLQRMGGVAEDIAAGDLSRRVEPATPKTEIGRLGLALNGMLSQIEAAFEQRKASENRLRRFIADASHELRTPLTSVRGYSEMLRRGAAESPSDSELARRRIEEESVRMSALVDDMLLIARLDQGRPLETKAVDLQAIARDAAADARVVAPQREIKLEAPSSVVVTGDDTRLRQVLGNLVRNALVHTPQQTPIEIGVSTEDGIARLSVADHGPGLKPDDVRRIFEPFYRADPSRSRDSGGAGLGLSIVSAVVSAHGGKVRVRETSGGGATFEVELPLASRSAQP